MRNSVALLAAIGLLTACSSSGSSGPSAPATSSTEAAPTTTAPAPITAFKIDKSQIIRTIAAEPGSAPSGIATGAGAVWVTEHRAGAIARLDPKTGKLVAQIVLPHAIGHVEDAAVVTDKYVFACIYDGANKLVRISTATNKLAGTVDVPCNGKGLGAHGIWVDSAGMLDLVDPDTMKVIRSLTVKGAPSDVGSDITEAGGSVWLFFGDGTLLRVDPRTGRVQKSWHHGSSTGLATTDGRRMYVTDPGTHTMRVIDVATNHVVHTIAVPGDDEGDPQLTYALGSLWLSTLNGGLARMDPKTLRITASVQLDTQDYIGEVGVGFGHVWYPGYGSDEVFEVRLLGS